MPDLPIAVLMFTDDDGARRLASRLGAPRTDAWRRLPRGAVVLVYGAVGLDALRAAALHCTLAGARAVVLVSSGAAQPMPWWGVRFHRILCASQAEALMWRSAGIALGRLVVIEGGPEPDVCAALRALVTEVSSMAKR
jgi:hypothetical protein